MSDRRPLLIDHELRQVREDLEETRERGRVRRARNAQLQEQVRALRKRLASTRRQVLSEEVLAALLPHRSAAARRRALEPGAVERDAQLRAASKSYADCLECELAGADQVEIAGLLWTVPDDARVAAIAERLFARQVLPLREILETREAVGGGTMLDIGANIGLTSIPRAILGDTNVVWCAEADPANYHALVRNVADNGLRGLVLPEHVAIGDRDGVARLHRTTSIGGHHIVADEEQRLETIEVPCLRLESWLARRQIDVRDLTFIKVDTQGAEGRVLRGAGQVLRRAHIVWQFEFAPQMLARAGTAPQGLLQQLRSSFTHFIDLNRHASGARVRAVGEIGEALAYVGESRHPHTNLLLFYLPES